MKGDIAGSDGSKRRFKAICFDFDGVLGRTMEDNYLAWVHAFSKHYLDIRKEDYFLIEGFSARKVAEHFAGAMARDGVIDSLVGLKEEFYRRNCSFSFYEGVEALVAALRGKGYRLGVVSGASFARLQSTAGREFLSNFESIVTGDRVINCKPHPEPYLKAAAALGVEPGECAVIENAPMGIDAAKSAGMYCIAIASTLERNHLSRADLVLPALADLGGLF